MSVDIVLRSPDSSQDSRVLIKMNPCVWWSRHATEKEMRADIERNAKHFLLLEHDGEIQAYLKYRLTEAAYIDSFAISDNAIVPLPSLTIYLLAEVAAHAKKQETVYIEVNEHQDWLMETLKSLGFETYETEFHMTKPLLSNGGADKMHKLDEIIQRPRHR